jgi:hypothetical protein
MSLVDYDSLYAVELPQADLQALNRMVRQHEKLTPLLPFANGAFKTLSVSPFLFYSIASMTPLLFGQG